MMSNPLLDRPLHLLLIPATEDQIKPLRTQLLRRAPPDPIHCNGFVPCNPTPQSKVMKSEKVQHSPDTVESEKQSEEGKDC